MYISYIYIKRSEGPGERLKTPTDEGTWREWMAATERRHSDNTGVSFEPGWLFLFIDIPP